MTPLLGLYLDKTTIQKDTCTPIFIAALFTVAKTWKQPKCPKWIKMWYIYTMDMTHPWKEWDNAICSNVDRRDYPLSEVSQTETSVIWYHLYAKSKKKKWYKWMYLQNRSRLTDLENKLMVTKGGRGKGLNYSLYLTIIFFIFNYIIIIIINILNIFNYI